jgi:multiple antibiotic resistance protein
MTIYSAALLLFLVMDPIGNVPLFLSVLRNYDAGTQRRIIVREMLFALFFLILFLFTGQYLQTLLNASESSLSIAGGIILFLIALKMVFPRPEGAFSENIEGEPFIVPLAVPFISGPTALATVSLIMTREPERWLDWLLALLLAWFVSGIILYFSSFLSRHLGMRGLIAIERLMGLIVIIMAVQMLLNGIREFLFTLQG